MSAKPGKFRLSHWLKKGLRLPPAKAAFFFENVKTGMAPRQGWARVIKDMPVRHEGLRPLDQAISTAGGLRFEALDDDLMLRDRPGVFVQSEIERRKFRDHYPRPKPDLY